MENSIKVVNKVGKDLSVRVDNVEGMINVTVEYPENRLKLSHLKPGDIFKADDMEYIVLEHLGNGTAAVIRKEPLSENMVFDFEDNNWKLCRIRRFLNSEYLEELKEVFGECNIVCHVTDLASLDGLKDYGKCTDKVSLLGIVQYWQYREYLGGVLYEPDDSWWLATPDSTNSGFGSCDVLHVGSMGDIGCAPCNFKRRVRPYFVLKDSVMVVTDGHVCNENRALIL